MDSRTATNVGYLPYILVVVSLIVPVLGWVGDGIWPSAHVTFLAMLSMQASALVLENPTRQAQRAGQDVAPVSATSIAYYQFVVRQHHRAGLALLVGTTALYGFIVATEAADSSRFIWLATLPLVFFALSVLRVWILRQRVTDGRFAVESSVETRELIDYLVMHADDDENDFSGKPRRVVLPPADSARAEVSSVRHGRASV
jgi:hypothetical protein